MAITSVTPTKVLRVNKGYTLVATAALGSLSSSDAHYKATVGTYGAKLPIEKKMTHYALLIENSAESGNADVYLVANGHPFFEGEDLKVTVAHGDTAVVQFDTGRYVQLSGADKGYLIVRGAAATVKVAIIELP